MPAVPAAAAKVVSPFAELMGELSDVMDDMGTPAKVPAAKAPATTPAPLPQQVESAVDDDTAPDSLLTTAPDPPATNAAPAEASKMPRKSGPSAAPGLPAVLKRGATAPVPFFSAPVPLPAPPPPTKPSASGSDGTQERPATTQKTEEPAPAERASVNDAALEVRIKPQQEEPQPAPTPLVPVTLKPLPELPPAPQIPLASPVPAIVAEAPARFPEIHAHAAPQQTAAPAPAAEIEEPAETPAAQPVRSVSLEFSPDGAGDVRLRLSEKAGEVHISLHSSDASITSRLHEGVHDLVGTLSSAGYEAEAWTRGQEHQNNPREQEQRRPRRAGSEETGEDFSEIFPQPIQEVS